MWILEWQLQLVTLVLLQPQGWGYFDCLGTVGHCRRSCCRNRHFASDLLDFESLFEGIPHGVFIKRALDLGCARLRYWIFRYRFTGRRIITDAGLVGGALFATRGICAGCPFACVLAVCVGPFSAWLGRWALLSMHAYIDDVCLYTHGPQRVVAGRLPIAARDFVENVAPQIASRTVKPALPVPPKGLRASWRARSGVSSPFRGATGGMPLIWALFLLAGARRSGAGAGALRKSRLAKGIRRAWRGSMLRKACRTGAVKVFMMGWGPRSSSAPK